MSDREVERERKRSERMVGEEELVVRGIIVHLFPHHTQNKQNHENFFIHFKACFPLVIMNTCIMTIGKPVSFQHYVVLSYFYIAKQ